MDSHDHNRFFTYTIYSLISFAYQKRAIIAGKVFKHWFDVPHKRLAGQSLDVVEYGVV